MQIGNINLRGKVMIVAEIGNNHEGSFTLAEEMVGRAAEAGADAVKFQTFIPELFVSCMDSARLEKLRSFCLSIAQFEKLSKQAEKANIIFFSTPLDLESAKLLNAFQPIFKIASGDNNFYPLIDTIAHFNKPMIVSTGLSDLALVKAIHGRIHDIWKKKGISPGLALLHCVSSYPVPREQTNLRAISVLRKHFPDSVIGYSDHTVGIEAAIYAVAVGAQIIEKHFTINKQYSDFRDHQLSADPDDFRQLVDTIRRVEIFLGVEQKLLQPCEESLQTAARRSIAAATKLLPGTILTHDHFIWVRPGTGTPPGNEATLIGCKLLRSLKQGELIMEGDVV